MKPLTLENIRTTAYCLQSLRLKMLSFSCAPQHFATNNTRLMSYNTGDDINAYNFFSCSLLKLEFTEDDMKTNAIFSFYSSDSHCGGQYRSLFVSCPTRPSGSPHEFVFHSARKQRTGRKSNFIITTLLRSSN